MLKADERLCACGCGQIIALKCGGFVVKEGLHRNKYYASKYHLPSNYRNNYDWCIENGFLKIGISHI